MVTRSICLLSLTVLLGACSSTAQRTYERDPLDRFGHYAGPPIDRFSYRRSLDGWRVVDDDRVVVWTTPDDAFLLTVDSDCKSFAKVSKLRLSHRATTSAAVTKAQ